MINSKALYNLTYGVFVISSRDNDIVNGCITNTCMQVANNPTRLAISILNKNYTKELIEKSGVFTISVLDETTTFNTIKHFGFQSGRDVNKFAGLNVPKDTNNIPYLSWQTCAYFSVKVIDSTDLGSHTVYIGEVTEAEKLNDNKPLTYAFYQENIKPKPAVKENKKIKAWRCKICGYVYEGSELPKDYLCPLCGHDINDFEPIYE